MKTLPFASKAAADSYVDAASALLGYPRPSLPSDRHGNDGHYPDLAKCTALRAVQPTQRGDTGAWVLEVTPELDAHVLTPTEKAATAVLLPAQLSPAQPVALDVTPIEDTPIEAKPLKG